MRFVNSSMSLNVGSGHWTLHPFVLVIIENRTIRHDRDQSKKVSCFLPYCG